MVDETEVLRAEERAADLRQRFNAGMVEEIKGWDQDRLLEAAEDCDQEVGSEHCWRCAAWALFIERSS